MSTHTSLPPSLLTDDQARELADGLTRARSGDRAAYANTLRLIAHVVRTHLRATLGPAPWTEEVVRACLLDVHAALHHGTPAVDVSSSLQAIVECQTARVRRQEEASGHAARNSHTGLWWPRLRHWAVRGTPAVVLVALVLGLAGDSRPARAQAPAPPPLPHFAGPRADAPVPRPGLTLRKDRVALVVTDPQNDFLSPKGVAWGVVGESVKENGTVENIERLLKSAKASNIPVFVSPHYYYPHDHRWQFGGALEALMHGIGMFDRKGALTQEAFEGSGADWLDRYKPYLNDGKTIVSSPHKVFGPETNDLVLQLRKADIRQVVLAGMSANLCTESHMRELLEQGFEVAVVTDATAAAKLPGFDGYEAAYVNFRLIASDVWSTADAVKRLASID